VDFFKHGRRDDPWEQLDHAKILQAHALLSSEVIGQEPPVLAVTRMIRNARVGIGLAGGASIYSRPKGIFFFVGPTGVGKTELAKQMAKLIFGDESAFIRFDMSEYAQEHAAERLTGAPPSYVGYEAGGQLTNAVKQRPFSLILFDEIEKAHPRILDKFLQILDDGRLTDGLGETVSFAKTVLIFTSNQGSTIRRPDNTVVRAVNTKMSYEEIRDHYSRAVRDYFQADLGRPEILNRFGNNIVVFDILRPDHIGPILDKFLRKLQESAREKHGLGLSLTDEARQLLIAESQKDENVLNGGRGIRNVVEDILVPAVNDAVFRLAPPSGSTLSIIVRDGIIDAEVK
jgi:ATP-dependent Clp protease ATP-binding subunit ClpA